MPHPVREPAKTKPHTRQARHTGTKGNALGDPFLCVCGDIHNQTKGAGNDKTARASAGPRMPGHTHLKAPRTTRQTRLHHLRPARTLDTRPMPRHAYGHNTCGDHMQQPWFPYVRKAPNFEYRGQKLYRMFDSSVIRTSSVTRRTTRVTEIGTFY